MVYVTVLLFLGAVTLLAQQLLNGVLLGAGYALFALGFTLMFGVLRVINLTYGFYFSAGAFVALFLTRDAGFGIWVALAAGRRRQPASSRWRWTGSCSPACAAKGAGAGLPDGHPRRRARTYSRHDRLARPRHPAAAAGPVRDAYDLLG